MTERQRTVEDFFDHELRDYAIAVVEQRAIPSVIDGFKPSQRKIAYSANKIWKTGNEKPLKVFQLGGRCAAETMFHHSSLDGTIITMTQKFKNSMPIFEGVGQFGTLRSPHAGAPRYIGVKFNDAFRLFYKDFDLLESQFEEGEEIEPKYFLPIIPAVLLNGGSGIAVGFASNILNRHPAKLVEACLDVLNGKSCPDLPPWINGFTGEFKQVAGAPRSWTIHGKLEVKNTSTVEITEIPPSWTYEQYESFLDDLIEKGKIVSYDDHSAETPHYIVKMVRQKLAFYQEKGLLEHLFKMQEGEGENFTTLDESGKLKIFNTAQEIVEYFVKFRLGFYIKRKVLMLQELDNDIRVMDNRQRFIKAIIDGNLQINNRKKQEIEADLPGLGLERIDRSFSYLLQMPIHSLTKEKFQELLAQIAQKQKERAKVQATEPKDMYAKDLVTLKAKLV